MDDNTPLRVLETPSGKLLEDFLPKFWIFKTFFGISPKILKNDPKNAITHEV